MSELRVIAVRGLPEVRPGDDLGVLLCQALAAGGPALEDGDIVVVTQKVVSKAEGRLVDLRTVEPSPFATDYAARHDKDARQVEVVLRESARIVRMDRGVLISETRHGFVCANAGVDASNAALETVALLPLDPDASAAAIRAALGRELGVLPAVVISDTFGRPWRQGIVNVAIGVAGMAPLRDYTGQRDPQGYELRVSVIAVADELASAAELVMGKLDGVPAAVVRGYAYPSGAGNARELVRDAAKDMFR
jgi:coenzyme F420-0:L-glutamate ligase / coenzyme F420-1:gamma-L-glutamate ligase